MRRQHLCGDQPAGSGRTARLDPLSMPLHFDAPDARADGHVRQIELHRERIVLRRSLHGMRMAINMRVCDFIGIARHVANDDQTLMLVHRDPSLSIPLPSTAMDTDADDPAQMWRDIFALPEIVERLCSPASRRRRHNAVKWRRPRFLMRRRIGHRLNPATIHRDEDEIIART